MSISKSELVSKLQTGVLMVHYTKQTTGEDATMRCTLKEEALLPTKGGQRDLEDVIAVVDLDKNAWRSFKIGNVKKVETVG
jgi:hypothetical protein